MEDSSFPDTVDHLSHDRAVRKGFPEIIFSQIGMGIQVKDPEIGLTHNVGGSGQVSFIHIFRRQ